MLLVYNNIIKSQQNVSACAQMGPGHIGSPPKKDKKGNAFSNISQTKLQNNKKLSVHYSYKLNMCVCVCVFCFI